MSDWIWLVGVTVLLVGVGRVVNLLVAQSHSVGLSEAITPTTLLWLASGLLVTFLGVGLRDE
jgi:HD-like signal output (HDOD) protein